jgi:hypothetical protein
LNVDLDVRVIIGLGVGVYFGDDADYRACLSFFGAESFHGSLLRRIGYDRFVFRD